METVSSRMTVLPDCASRVTLRASGSGGERTWAHSVSDAPPVTLELTVTA